MSKVKVYLTCERCGEKFRTGRKNPRCPRCMQIYKGVVAA